MQFTEWQMPVRILEQTDDPSHYWDAEGRVDILLKALQVMRNRFGDPAGVGRVTVLPMSAGMNRTAIISPGWIQHESLGGFCSAINKGVVAQWLSSSVQLHSYRERWLYDAVSIYLRYMLVESLRGSDQLSALLGSCREGVRSAIEQKSDIPLASSAVEYMEKGAWIIHMIRNLMNTVDSTRDATFSAWLVAVVGELNDGSLSNQDFQELTEHYFGYDLDWFFRKWVQETGIPRYRVQYSTSQREDGYYLDMDVSLEGVSKDFMAPVLLRIDSPPDVSYTDCFILPHLKTYHLGPYKNKPTELHFNKSYSVLSDDEVTRKR